MGQPCGFCPKALCTPQHALKSLSECRILVSSGFINENTMSSLGNLHFSKMGKILTWYMSVLKGPARGSNWALPHMQWGGIYISCGPEAEWVKVGWCLVVSVLQGVLGRETGLWNWNPNQRAGGPDMRAWSNPGTFLPTVCCPDRITEPRVISH